MKFLFDFSPIILFFAVYKVKDLHFYQNEGLHSAIIAMTVAILLQIIITYIYSKKFEKAQLIGLLLLILFGGMTIYIDSPAFIMWKVSVLYALFALVLLSSVGFAKQTLLQRILGKQLDLPSKVWTQLSWLWGLGFIGIAIINAYYYVLPSIRANDVFFGVGERFGLSGYDCANSAKAQLCLAAQQLEESWVNFKLFGTMGLTFILLIITVTFISKYIKDQP